MEYALERVFKEEQEEILRIGESKGMEIGKREGMLEAAKKMLDAGAEWNFVVKSLDLSRSEILELKKRK